MRKPFVRGFAVAGVCVWFAAWAAACGSDEAAVSSGDDAGADATTDAIAHDAARDTAADSHTDTGVDTGADADAGRDADAADVEAEAQICTGSPGTTVNVACPPSGSVTPCTLADAGDASGDAACGYQGSAMFSQCTPTSCVGTGSGIDHATVCFDDSTCTIQTGGIDFCAACGANATCVITDQGSAGSQAFYCGPGSDCTININGASGSRIIDCSRARRCRVNGFVSGDTKVSCPADCNVVVTGGFSQVCCDTPPIRCQDGHYQCGVDGGVDGGDGGC
jgi:hypothetical protein